MGDISTSLSQTEKSQIVCFTGHRIIGGAETNQLWNITSETIKNLIKKGMQIFISGGAIGFDTLAAQVVLRAREHNPNIKLIMALPCKNHEARWREADKKAYRHLLDNADEVVFVSEQPYFDGCMEKRNQFLAKYSGVCVAYMKRGRSGTSQTVRMARERRLSVINLGEKAEGVKVMVDFEKAFSDFIDSNEYDKADEAFTAMLFTTARSSYMAGWLAAGGEMPQTKGTIQYSRPARVIPFRRGTSENE